MSMRVLRSYKEGILVSISCTLVTFFSISTHSVAHVKSEFISLYKLNNNG